MQLPRYHRLRHSFYRLEGTRCGPCDKSYFPPRSVCPSCHAEALDAITFKGSGTLYSYSKMNQSPRGFANLGPYTVGMVQLDGGPLIMAQLTDVDGVELEIGMELEMVTRKLREESEHGYIVYGYKFRPLLERATPPGPAHSGAAAASNG